MVSCGHVERRFQAGSGGHRIDGIIGRAVWAMPPNEAQGCAQLLRARIRVRQDRADGLLQVERPAASRRCGAEPSWRNSNDSCWPGPVIH